MIFTRNTVDRYIFRQALFSIGAITLILTCAVWLTQSLRFIDIVINKGFPLSIFFKMILLLLPDLLHLVTPGATLIAVLMTFHRLTVDQELTILRATGFSNMRIARPILILGFFLSLILYLISFYLLPHSFQNLRNIEFSIRNNLTAQYLTPGEFNTYDDIMIYVKNRSEDNHFQNLFIYSEKMPEKPFYILAKEGKLYKTDDGHHLILFQGTRYDYNKLSKQPSRLRFGQYALQLKDIFKEKARDVTKPYELYFGELLNPSPRTLQKIAPLKLGIELHQRLLTPFFAFLFSLIAVSAMLYGEIQRRFKVQKILIAILTSVGTQGLTYFLINASSTNGWTISLCYGLILVITLGAFVFLHKNWKI